jgi:hypothetical protein
MTVEQLIQVLERLQCQPTLESDQVIVSIDSGLDEPLLYGIYDVTITDGHIMIGLKEEEI